jgi:hypothetical protein
MGQTGQNPSIVTMIYLGYDKEGLAKLMWDESSRPIQWPQTGEWFSNDKDNACWQLVPAYDAHERAGHLYLLNNRLIFTIQL